MRKHPRRHKWMSCLCSILVAYGLEIAAAVRSKFNYIALNKNNVHRWSTNVAASAYYIIFACEREKSEYPMVREGSSICRAAIKVDEFWGRLCCPNTPSSAIVFTFSFSCFQFRQNVYLIKARQIKLFQVWGLNPKGTHEMT